MPNASHFNPHLPCGRRLSGTSGHLDLLAISIHTFLAEGDTQINETITHIREFQSTPSLRKATESCLYNLVHSLISIHTFLAEGDTKYMSFTVCRLSFQSTPSLRKATEAGDSVLEQETISIHTFLAEGDNPDGPD